MPESNRPIRPGSAAFLEILVDTCEVVLDDDGLVVPTGRDCALCREPLSEAEPARHHRICARLYDKHGMNAHKHAVPEQRLRELARAAYYTTARLMDLWKAAEDGSAEGELYNDAHSMSCSLDYEDGGEASFPLSDESYAEMVAEYRAALMALPWPPAEA